MHSQESYFSPDKKLIFLSQNATSEQWSQTVLLHAFHISSVVFFWLSLNPFY